ncbi:MAG: hypothetical protein H7A24_09575 [Leptospiraceae bacterium]|nr:hypothetical protein [Leptospiraceae bacterium]
MKDSDWNQNSDNTELLSLKSALREILSDEVLQPFRPIEYIYTDLSGNIHLKTGMRPNSLLFRDRKDMQNVPARFSTTIQLILDFYESQFARDDELLDWLTNTLLKINRLSDLIKIINKYKNANVLPLHFQIFFILVGIFDNNLQNLVFSGDEEKIENILYKFKFLEISRLEKNRLYDLVMTGENPDLLGILFYLFNDTFRGIRNIYSVFDIIKERFDVLELKDKKEFIESYKETGNLLKTFFLMKKVYSPEEVKSWFAKEKEKYGKSERNQENCFPGYDETEDIIQKYKYLKVEKKAHTLSPFEIILLMNTSLALQLKNEILSIHDIHSNSYITNRALAVLNFFEMDYKKFLLYLERSGSLKNHSECLYLKAIAYLELGYRSEAYKILSILNQYFPDATVIKESLKRIDPIKA